MSSTETAAVPRPGRARRARPGAAGPTGTHPGWSLGDPGFDERYRAIDARDTRFDGQFFTAVHSTGIYCRPSCPARTPKAEHVTFYVTSAAAHEAGFRACKRCLPEATPGTPAWDLRRDLTGRAMRLIADGVVDRDGVDGLADRLGYTSRHVQRLLTTELGAGPLALARARRAQTARSLLVGTDLPIAEVAFAAGFGSIRQFNETVLEVFAVRPGDLRDRARSRHPHRADAADTAVSAASATGADTGAPVRLDLDLPVRQPFDAPGVFRFLAVRALPGVESADAEPSGTTRPDRLRYARTLTLPHGPGAVELTAERRGTADWRVRARLELASLADVGTAVARIRRLLDLDADPAAIDAALAADPALAPLVAAAPGIRVPGAVDPHELVIRALVGQQISVAAARSHLGRLAAVAGTPYASGIPGLTRLFPTPSQLVAAIPEPPAEGPLDPDRPLRLPRRNIVAVRNAAGALADGGLRVDVGADPETLRADLVARPGIGPWTAAYLALRVLGDPDAWLDGDVALVAGAKATGALDPDVPKAAAHRELAARAASWAPWRSYATMHLWQAALPTPTTASRTEDAR
ncbi:AlkA N-terminal domain-containing protein [Agromyces seonyuensis]|uniref:DNA-3-methyladenine glycosylase II n=1 Tax=Agromyces seonyuensis TaxID=2662446 RepID=A0A6I4NY15_9MICO|nr:AlkA N-terminal domain-containing protein [Agromyces seonyuensis]MWB99183.1 helix-turn-helix domain-containing protein [Agromyces seonyuensis]